MRENYTTPADSTQTPPAPQELNPPADACQGSAGSHLSQPAAKLPELLAPAGDWECARAAVENGADAIYFGLEKFNARMRAQNFTEADLPKLMTFLHRRGVKGYVAFNILVFENELDEAEQYARAIIAAGVDAAIVQDVGICRLIRRLSPDFPIHVSTQMTITSAAGIEFARELGCNLVVLARECSLKEIEKIVTPHAALPLEVFIHGALCVAYSGQCLTSEALGGRSANRGECAQACRMPYELISDGKLVPLGDRKYLLSPQDLAGIEVLPELVRLGIASLKIEGRLKTAEYVANITRLYREALKNVECRLRISESRSQLRTTHSAFGSSAIPQSEIQIQNIPQYEMEMAFSRGLYTGWFHGTNNQALVHAHFGKKRGVYLGKIAELRPQAVLVQLEGPLKPGDGVVFDAGKPEEKEEGGRVYEIKPQNENARSHKGQRSSTDTSAEKIETAPPVLLTFGRGDVDFSRLHPGDKIWKTSDPELDRRLRKSFAGDNPRFQRPISFEVHGLEGKPLTLIARDELGHVVRVDSQLALARAEKQPLTVERLRDQLGRLGGTPFFLGELTSRLESPLLLPLSELNRLRRHIVAELETLRSNPPRWTLASAGSDMSAIPQSAFGFSEPKRSGGGNPQLIVLVRSLAQLEAVLGEGVHTIYCELEDPKKYREAVQTVHKADAASVSPDDRPRAIFVAPPRIFKMGEEWTLKQVRSCDADGYLVRNYDHLNFFANDRRVGDYSLNIANRLTADYFKNRFSLERITASYDLNFTQLEALLSAAPPEWFEVTIHQHMPMFHMEHCVFCAFLSSGTDYTNCGRPCDKHDLKLLDRVGAQHPIKADVGCRNTVFNALAQTGAEYVSRMLTLGLRHFRLEFLNETPDQVARTIGKYRQLLAGRITGAELWRELKLFNQLGITRGQMGNPNPEKKTRLNRR